jgi:hypothetical protein
MALGYIDLLFAVAGAARINNTWHIDVAESEPPCFHLLK